MKRDTLITIPISGSERTQYNKRAVNDEVKLSQAVRKFLELWEKRDKRALSIVEEAKREK